MKWGDRHYPTPGGPPDSPSTPAAEATSAQTSAATGAANTRRAGRSSSRPARARPAASTPHGKHRPRRPDPATCSLHRGEEASYAALPGSDDALDRAKAGLEPLLSRHLRFAKSRHVVGPRMARTTSSRQRSRQARCCVSGEQHSSSTWAALLLRATRDSAVRQSHGKATFLANRFGVRSGVLVAGQYLGHFGRYLLSVGSESRI